MYRILLKISDILQLFPPKQNLYIWSIAKSNRKIVGSCYISRMHLIASEMLYMYKSMTRLKMGHGCHISGWLSYLELPSSHFTALTEFKSIYVAFWVMNYFPSYNRFPFHVTPRACRRTPHCSGLSSQDSVFYENRVESSSFTMYFFNNKRKHFQLRIPRPKYSI